MLRNKLQQLTLNSTAIWEKEEADGPIQAPWLIKVPYLVLCWFLDTVFEGKYVPSRFFFLETVARMPYFSYITMLHLYETLGFWRRSADIKRIHFAEEINEFRHLLIMEVSSTDHGCVRQGVKAPMCLTQVVTVDLHSHSEAINNGGFDFWRSTRPLHTSLSCAFSGPFRQAFPTSSQNYLKPMR